MKLWNGQGEPESLAKAILTLLKDPDQLKAWGQWQKKLRPTYLQQNCLDQLEELLNSNQLYTEPGEITTNQVNMSIIKFQ